MPAPGERGDANDAFAIVEAPYEQGSLPMVPGLASPRAGEAPPPHHAGPFASVPRAPTTTAIIEGERLGHDPGVAVGERHLLVYTAHRYEIHDKATGELARPEHDDEVPIVADFNTLFSPVWAPLDKRGRTNPHNLNDRLRFRAADPLPCDPADPLGPASRGCVREFYDSRVQWDPVRRRFWIESAVRNHLWFCPPAPRVCDDPRWSPTQPRRFIAIAVSRTEDPRKGFHRYVLVDEYADWPKMTIAERYLVLAHMSSAHVYVFDADALAAGNPTHGAVRVASLDGRTFPGARHLNPVTQRGPSEGVTLLVGTDGGGDLTLFGLLDPEPARAAPPVALPPISVRVGGQLGGFTNNAVYRGGMLYLAWDECEPGSTSCLPRHLRLLRLPVTRSGASRLEASRDPARGFLDLRIGGREPDDAADDVVDYAMPVLDVNAAGDVVIGYARHGHTTKKPLPFELRYSILYHGETTPRPGVLVSHGTWEGAPDIRDNGKVGIDLGGAEVDPSDDATVWFSHALSDGAMRWYRQLTTAVRP
jgi:hypothetical protein